MLWIIFPIILVLLLCLLLSAKVGVRILYETQLVIWIKAGPVVMQVYPAKKKKKHEKKKASKSFKEETKKEKQPRNVTADAVWHLVSALLPPTFDMMERISCSMHIQMLRLHLIISDPNPAVAARRYGNVNAVLWPVLSAMGSLVTVEQQKVDLELDFAARRSTADGELFVTLRIYHGIAILLADGKVILKAVLRFMKETKPDTAQKQKKTEKESAAA